MKRLVFLRTDHINRISKLDLKKMPQKACEQLESLISRYEKAQKQILKRFLNKDANFLKKLRHFLNAKMDRQEILSRKQEKIKADSLIQ